MYTYMQNLSSFNFGPHLTPGGAGFLGIFSLILVLFLWTIVLKGYALWHAARGSQKWWFIALLVINTVGILEIVYLIWFRPKNVGNIVSETPVNISSSVR